MSILALELEAKLLSLLHELVPNASVAGIIVNPDNRPIAEGFARVAQKAERTFGMVVHVLNARSDEEIDAAFAALQRLRAGALVVGADPLFETRRDRLVTLAARQALPALYFDRVFALAGGLASYGADLDDASRRLASTSDGFSAARSPRSCPSYS